MHKFILADRHPALVEAWQNEFRNHPNFEFYAGDVFDKKAEVIVSPANSFGIMDGGIDLVYSQKMGWDLSKRLQEKIRDEYDGELLVGQAAVLETNYPQFPYMISAPTMRIPMFLRGTPNVYLAAKAIFLAMKKFDDGLTCLIPGLGTGCGAVPYELCAQKMRLAYEDFYIGRETSETVYPKSLMYANLKHRDDITL
jgi:O-acetyl-ADP-ribose deacetylase (regulator of RNase III)